MGRLNYDSAPALGVPTAANGDVSNQAASTAFVQNLVPPGVVFPYAGSVPPTGWLLADGSAVSRTTYARLFSAIGTTYGAGDGSTTFNLPELRGEFLRGLDNGRGVDAGRALGTAQGQDVQSHSHDVKSSTTGAGGSAGDLVNGTGANTTPTTNTGGSETRPRNVALNYIIKSQ